LIQISFQVEGDKVAGRAAGGLDVKWFVEESLSEIGALVMILFLFYLFLVPVGGTLNNI
jgi:hypothetical protein